MDRRYLGDRGKGVVYTRPRIVRFSLDLAEIDDAESILVKRMLDVGCGYGQFIGENASRIVMACKSAGLSRDECVALLTRNLRGVEINEETCYQAKLSVRDAVEAEYPSTSWAKAWLNKIVIRGDYLDPEIDSALGGKFDLICGNLPYVRYDRIHNLPGNPDPDDLRKRFTCFRGRCDYSVAFMEKIIGSLTPSGRTCIITSNSFTRTDYGGSLRKLIAEESLQVDELDFGSMPIFDEHVNAYASLFILQKSEQPMKRLITMRSGQIDYGALDKIVKLGFGRARSCTQYRKIARDKVGPDDAPWSPISKRTMKIIRRVCDLHRRLGDSYFTVKKGPATGADRVFIQPEGGFEFSPDVRKKYVRKYFRAGNKKGPEEILCLYKNGQLIEFEKLPRAIRNYLLRYKDDLQQRYIVYEGGREWWGTIDKVNRDIADLPKVMISDYGSPNESIDFNGINFVPGHSVVYIIHDDEEILKQLSEALIHPLISLFRIWNSPTLRGTKMRSASTVIQLLPEPSFEASDADCYGLTEKELRQLSTELEDIQS